MRAIPYLISGILVAPGTLLAYFLWSATEAIRQENFFKFLLFLLLQFGRTVQWGFWVLAPAVIVWVALAFLEKYRWMGALGMALVAVLSLVEMFAVWGPPKSLGDLWFPTMSAMGLALNVWLVWDGLPWAKPR